MNTQQLDKLKMYDAVISFCNQRTDIISSMPALQSVFNRFRDTVSSIRDMAQQKALDTKSVSRRKKELRKALEKMAVGIAATVTAYARSVNDIELEGQVKYKATDFKLLRDEELPVICQNISNFVTASLAGLAAYNITAATVTEFNVLIDQFRTILPRPRNAITQRRRYSVELRQLFVTADDILKTELDNIITNLQTPNPDFHSLYMSNRMIVDTPTKTTQIKGLITDGTTNKPIRGAIITIKETGSIAITSATGKYTLKPVSSGPCTVMITKEAYTPMTLTEVDVKQGQIAKADAVLVKIVPEKK